MSNETYDAGGNPSYLQGNSKSDQEDKKKEIQKVTSGKVKKKEKPALKRLSEAVLAEDVKEVKSYLLWDVLIPALKDTLSDLGKRGIDGILYGTGKSPSIERYGNASYKKYQDASRRPRRSSSRTSTVKYNRRAAYDFDDILFDDRRDAEAVLEHLADFTVEYGMTSVADFYDLVGMATSYVDNRYGWDEVSDARVVRVRDGYIIELPKPHPLDED